MSQREWRKQQKKKKKKDKQSPPPNVTTEEFPHLHQGRSPSNPEWPKRRVPTPSTSAPAASPRQTRSNSRSRTETLGSYSSLPTTSRNISQIIPEGNKKATREETDHPSALSGYSPVESVDSNLSSGSTCPFNSNPEEGKAPEAKNDKYPELYTPEPSPSTTYTHISSTMASFDSKLEHYVLHIMKHKLDHPIALVLDQAYITTFDDFRSLVPEDVVELTYMLPNGVIPLLMNAALIRQLQRGIAYTRYKEDLADVESDDPVLWNSDMYSKWSRNGYAIYLQTVPTVASGLMSTNIGSSDIIDNMKKDDDAALISWNRKPRDVAKYPLLKTDADYQDWKLKMKRQLIADTLSRVTDPTFKIALCRVGADMELAKLQINYFEQILAAVLLNPEGKGLVTTHPEDAQFVWKEHEAHQNASDSAQISTTALMNKLMGLKIADSPTRHSFLISFQEVCNRYDQIADVKLGDSFKRTLLQASIMHDTALLNSWNTVNEVKRAVNPNATPATYSEFINFLVNQSKTHDIATPFKRNVRHAHKANFDSFDDGNNDLDDDTDSVLDDVLAHMSIQNEPMSEETINALQVFSTFQRRRNGPARARDPEAEIPHPLYSEVSRELKSAWSREDPKIKKRILQCKQQTPKQGAKKNAELGVYMIEADGYASESDASAYSDATYAYDADDTPDDSGDTSGDEGNDLTVNAAASRQRRQPTGGILRKKKDLPRKSELPPADPRRFLANKATPVRNNKDGKIIGHFTYGASMAKLINRFDEISSLVPKSIESTYFASAYASKFFNESLALMDGGANGGIGGRDMKLMYYNTDGRRVNIGIAGDHQMTGKKLGTFCAVVTTQLGRVLGIFHQYANVPEQAKSIHSRCQFQAHGNLVGDTATIYGGPQRIDTSDGYQLPLSIRSGLPYIHQTYPNNDDMNLPQVEFTSPAEWNPDLHDDNRTQDEMIRQFPAVPHEAANEFYDLKGNINLELLRRVKTAEIKHLVDNDDDSVDSEMPGLQPRQHEDTSSDEDSDQDQQRGKASTTMQWKIPIDDSNGEKFTCPRVRKQRAKRNEKRLTNRRKKAALKKERIKATPFAEDADEPFVPLIETVINNEQSKEILNDEEAFFPTDPHPYRTGTIIEENGFLFKEREMDGLIFYDSLEVLDDPNKTLDIIKDSNQYWTTFSGAPSLNSNIGHTAALIDGLVDSGCIPCYVSQTMNEQ